MFVGDAPSSSAPEAAAREIACDKVLCCSGGALVGCTVGKFVPLVAEAAQLVTEWPIDADS